MPTDEQLSRLPKWAQDHIQKLDSERVLAVRALHEYTDEQTESSVWYDDAVCTGEQQGPEFLRRYIQTHKITFKLGDTERDTVDIYLREDGLQINTGFKQLVFQPQAANSILIVKEKTHAD